MLYRKFSSQSELDAAYDVELSVPDFQAYLGKFEAATQAARAALKHELAVPIGPALDERCDLFPAAEGVKSPPIVVFVHGGYWRLSDGNDYSFAANGLHRHAAVSVVNYSLAPKVPMWEIVRQVRASVAWAWKNAERIGGDRNRIFLVGHSAGAHLSVMAGLTDWVGDYGLPSNVVKGVFAVSGLYDLRPLPYTFVGPSLQLSTRDVVELSPMLRDLPEAAPLLKIAYGADEPSEFVRQSDDFFARWKSEGLKGELSVHPNRDHFSIILDLQDPSSKLVSEIASFIA